MRLARLSCFLLLLCGTLAMAAPQFPALTGRVVDAAHVLSPGTVQSLDDMLADYERGTSNQVVVVTIPSLQNIPIEEYGYQLGRAWQIGQKGKNNGALLIVAPSEHKVRIEVGYGLEPVLTDAASSTIIHSIILPAFSAGKMQQGIIDGTQAMLSVLGGKGMSAQAGNASNLQSGLAWLGLLLFLFLWFFLYNSWSPVTAGYLLASGGSRWGSSRLGTTGWGGGGFGGGGGSFGGGGASGSW